MIVINWRFATIVHSLAISTMKTALAFIAGSLIAGSFLGQSMAKQFEDLQQSRNQAYCKAGLSAACVLR